MALRTPICDLLGIEVPIVQAPMTARLELALAVADAGALGMVQIFRADLPRIPEVMRQIAGRSIGVNLVLEWPQEERLEVALEHGARIVSFFWGDPGGMVDRVHDAGGIVLHTVGSVEEARRAEANGADVVVAQGVEAGGHVWGHVSTLVLVPAVVDAVGVPVIAAGGIADGRGVAAALMLGAQAAWLGTRFVASEEAPHLYKERVVAASETETAYSTIFSEGWPDSPHRTIVNEAVRSGEPRSALVPQSADELETAALYAGQSSGLVHDLAPAGELVRRIAAEAEALLR
jgi:nitronate monooxygenase